MSIKYLKIKSFFMKIMTFVMKIRTFHVRISSFREKENFSLKCELQGFLASECGVGLKSRND